MALLLSRLKKLPRWLRRSNQLWSTKTKKFKLSFSRLPSGLTHSLEDLALLRTPLQMVPTLLQLTLLWIPSLWLLNLTRSSTSLKISLMTSFLRSKWLTSLRLRTTFPFRLTNKSSITPQISLKKNSSDSPSKTEKVTYYENKQTILFTLPKALSPVWVLLFLMRISLYDPWL